MAPVVVSGKHQGGVGQGEQLVLDAVVERAGVAAGKIGAPGAVDEQRVPGADTVADVQADTVGCVAGRREHAEREGADLEVVPVVHVPIDVRRGRPPVHDDWRVRQGVQLPTAGQVIGVGMRVDDRVERVAVVGEHRNVTGGFLQNRIDECRFPRFFAPDHIRLGRAAVEFAKQHGGRLSAGPPYPAAFRPTSRGRTGRGSSGRGAQGVGQRYDVRVGVVHVG